MYDFIEIAAKDLLRLASSSPAVVLLDSIAGLQGAIGARVIESKTLTEFQKQQLRLQFKFINKEITFR